MKTKIAWLPLGNFPTPLDSIQYKSFLTFLVMSNLIESLCPKKALLKLKRLVSGQNEKIIVLKCTEETK